jgi:hypothetical protein
MEFTEQELEQAQIEKDRISKMIQYYEQMRADFEMKALIFTHEVSRLKQELAVSLVILGSDKISEQIAEIHRAIEVPQGFGFVATAHPVSYSTSVTIQPEHVHRWVDRIDEETGKHYSTCEDCPATKQPERPA